MLSVPDPSIAAVSESPRGTFRLIDEENICTSRLMFSPHLVGLTEVARSTILSGNRTIPHRRMVSLSR